MRIAINGKPLGIREKGGAVRVAERLIEHMARQRPDIRFEVYLPVEHDLPGDWHYPDNVIPHLSRSPAYRSGARRSLWEQWTLPGLVRANGPYRALLNLTNSAPVLRDPGTPQLLLIHDAGFLNRAWFSRAYSGYMTRMLAFARRRGIHLVTVSQTSAREIAAALPWTAGMHVVPNGIDCPPGDIIADDPGYPYVLFLGSLNPRKNLQGAIDGFRRFKARHPGALRLRIAGAAKPIFAKTTPEPAGDTDIVYEGYVDDRRKWSLLKGARALLLPSFMEGFGLPVGEALQVGTAAVISDIPVFRELFGGLPVYVDPRSNEDIARGLEDVLIAGRGTVAPDACNRFRWMDAANAWLALTERVA